MGNRLSKIYTKTGDDGTTGTATGERLAKDDVIFMAMGDIDELNSHIGMMLALIQTSTLPHFADEQAKKDILRHELTVIQHLLFNLGGELAVGNVSVYRGIDDKHVAFLETCIDKMNETLPYLKDFILPKGTPLVCQTHIARSVARRAERMAVSIRRDKPVAVSDDGLKFLNRLSDYLFVLARHLTDDSQVKETLWQKDILTDLS